jgi:purine-nucleoside phosphorylase
MMPRFGGKADLAVILGSGLSAMEGISAPVDSCLYGDFEDLPAPTVTGHPGRIFLLRERVLVFAGRAHLYEEGKWGAAAGPVRLAADLGCRSLLLTQAAGSLRAGLRPGSWMLAGDIVSLPFSRSRLGFPGSRTAGKSPLISEQFRTLVSRASLRAGVGLENGTLFWTPGPNYETAAEAIVAQRLGADAATMSPLPELVEAAKIGMEAACLSWITNHTANVSREETGHEKVVRMGKVGAGTLLRIVQAVSREMRGG